MNMIEICPVVIEIRRVENGKLAVPVNNTLVCHTAFLAADTQLCVLMASKNDKLPSSKQHISIMHVLALVSITTWVSNSKLNCII